MRVIKLYKLIAIVGLVFTVGCSATSETNKTEVKKEISEELLGLRKTDLYSETSTIGDKTQYSDKPAGTSKSYQRAFENAPPMIPHSVDGMLPITTNNNQCKACHEPAVAQSMGATPIPKSHFTNFRPDTKLGDDGKIIKDGKAINNTSDVKVASKNLQELSGSRFSCSQCHTPQSEGNNVPKNNFQAEFRSEGLNSKSNLSEIINEGVK
ncbi:MAG: nitrate reductase cytochrome c-type subunit [Campylobacterota bacterium]